MGSGHFDTVEGGQKEAEPQRETVEPSSTNTTATRPAVAQNRPPSGAPAPAASRGSWYVQVFAGGDRSSADSLVGKLRDAGFAARWFIEESQYKVRVGGYATRGEADAMKTRLQGQGHEDAWLTQIR